jgi:hypothetical protein
VQVEDIVRARLALEHHLPEGAVVEHVELGIYEFTSKEGDE